ncbi:MAG: hypothetical protein BYD32DRAFT_458037 [Podila humilis]|nr:MAG: hypothetical protein BYD32DRAFT_458037 [Podila humilis]
MLGDVVINDVRLQNVFFSLSPQSTKEVLKNVPESVMKIHFHIQGRDMTGTPIFSEEDPAAQVSVGDQKHPDAIATPIESHCHSHSSIEPLSLKTISSTKHSTVLTPFLETCGTNDKEFISRVTRYFQSATCAGPLAAKTIRGCGQRLLDVDMADYHGLTSSEMMSTTLEASGELLLVLGTS